MQMKKREGHARLDRVEDAWEHEVELRPELGQVVLQRRARDEQPTTRDERPNDFGEDGVDVLDAVRLVDDDVLERELLECALLDETDLVGGDADFKVLGDEAARHNLRTLLLRPSEDDGLEIGRPLLELALPVAQS